MKQEAVFWSMNSAERINHDLQRLPIAKRFSLFARGENRDVASERFTAVVVGNEIVACPTKTYKLVQHEKAFRPIVEGLTLAGVKDFKYSLYWNNKKANLNIYTDTASDAVQGIQFGFRVWNSVDGRGAITYGFRIAQRQKFFELVGYRLACSNGMVVRVPLEEAEFTKVEERVKVEELLNKTQKIIHTGDVDGKIMEMQYITEAIGILSKPLERMITKAKKIKLEDIDQVEKIIEKYVGKRNKERIVHKYLDNEDENRTLWELYNAVTFVASHEKLAYTTRMGLLERSGAMLTEVLVETKV